jgi:chaperone required for assembly of F1-ATPase
MKRFWDRAEVSVGLHGHEITLDGRPMRLPSGATLIVHPPQLAAAIADEWQAAGKVKGGEMSFVDTPLTRLAGTAQERILPAPALTIDAIARYGESDLLCYRAAGPEELVRRQTHGWQPWLDWAERTYAAPLRVTAGLTLVKQHHDSVAALRSAVGLLNCDLLAALGIAVPALGSLVLGLAMMRRELGAEDAYALSVLDELFQAEQWGDDEEASTRRQNVRTDVILAGRYMDLTRENA